MAERKDWSAEPLETLGLSVRAHRCVQRRGVATIGQLCAMSELELLEHQSWGETTLREIRDRLAERGLRMREKV
jgi:DNA-directed RNA polymerase subunit alpha